MRSLENQLRLLNTTKPRVHISSHNRYGAEVCKEVDFSHQIELSLLKGWPSKGSAFPKSRESKALEKTMRTQARSKILTMSSQGPVARQQDILRTGDATKHTPQWVIVDFWKGKRFRVGSSLLSFLVLLQTWGCCNSHFCPLRPSGNSAPGSRGVLLLLLLLTDGHFRYFQRRIRKSFSTLSCPSDSCSYAICLTFNFSSGLGSTGHRQQFGGRWEMMWEL